MKKIVHRYFKSLRFIPFLLFIHEDISAQCILSHTSQAGFALGHPQQFVWSVDGIQSNIATSTQKQTALCYFACNTDSLQWLEAKIYLDINPSSANFLDVFFRCDSTLQNGWLLRLGDTEDGLKLIERRAGKERIECGGEGGYFNKSKSNITLRWVKQRDQFLLLYKDSSWEDFRTLCAAVDTLPYRYHYTGIGIVQTGSSAAGKHRVETYTVGPPRPDKTPATVKSLQWKSTALAEIQFSEPILLENKNQLICNFQQALAFTQPNKKTILAQFNPQTCNQSHSVYVQNAKDSAGNIQPLQKASAFVTCPTPISPYEVTITEIMADPQPSLGYLPPVQYIELKNHTPNRLWLSELSLSDAQTRIALPKILLQPHQRITLCDHADTTAMKGIPNVVGCALPHINIESDLLTLTNQQNQTVHQFQYQQFMHHPSYSQGGYSLEHIDSNAACIDHFMWTSNTAQGGTPSLPPATFKSFPTQKSQPPNHHTAFQVAYLAATHPDTALLIFNHPVDDSLPPLKMTNQNASYTFQPLKIGSHKYVIQPPLQNQQIVEVKIGPIINCNGDTLQQSVQPLGYSSLLPSAGQLQFNEVMFNALDAQPDYLEVVNTSQQPLQLMGLQLQIITDQQPEDIITLSTQPFILYPREIRCFSAEPYALAMANNPNVFHRHQRVVNFPNLPASGATLRLTHPSITEPIDEMTYSESMHSPVILSNKGVSLEKTSPTAPSNQSMHWVSATTTAGYATPGETNSQCSDARKTLKKVFELDKTVYNLPTEEYITVIHNLPKSGYVVKPSLFSMMGSRIPLNIPPTQVSQDGQLLLPLWMIKNNLPSGNYILHIDAFHPDADICRQNLRLVLVH